VKAPRISILTGCYNDGHLLGEQIASVQASAMRDYEHIIVLDGCTDDSQRVAACAALNDDRIHVLARRERRGLAAALNYAFEHATAPWVLKLDADDLIGPAYLAEVVETAYREPDANVIFSPAIVREANGRERVYRYPERFSRGSHAEYLYIAGPAATRRSVVEAVGGFDERLLGAEDWDFHVRAELAVGLHPVQLPEAHWTYRQHGGQRMTDYTIPREKQLKAHLQQHTRETAVLGWRHPDAPVPPVGFRREEAPVA